MWTTFHLLVNISKTKIAAWVNTGAVAMVALGCSAGEEPALGDGPVQFRCAPTTIPGIGGLDTVTVNGSATLHGRDGAFDVFSNGPVQIAGSAEVDGGVYSASAQVELFDGGSILGEITGNSVAVPDWIPDDEVYYIWYYRENSYTGWTDYGRDPTTSNNYRFSLYGGDSIEMEGLYYFTSLSLTGGATLELSGDTFIVVDGPMTVSGGSRIITDDASQVLFIGTDNDDIEISGGSDVTARMYAPYAPVMVSGTGTRFSGGLVGGTLQLSGSSDLEVTEDALHIWDPC